MGVQADPRSPERGQYGFLQDLVRRVAYDTLARKERKTRHLAAAAQLEESFGEVEQEVVEVVAAHYVAAYEAQPDADDADTIRQSARELLSRAGERAGSLAALGEARKYFEQAAELSDEPLEKARLLERAGAVATDSAEFDAAERAFFAALELLEQADQRHAAARVLGRIAHVEMFTGRSEQARERLERAFAAVAADEPDADVADLASRLAQSYAFSGAPERAVEPVELALEVAQALRLPETLIRGLLVKAMLARAGGRPEEELAFQRHAVRYALEHDLSASTTTAYGNLSDACFQRDRYGEALEVLQEALTHARRVGDRRNELYLLSEMSYTLTMTGRWEEALADYTELPEEHASPRRAYSRACSAVSSRSTSIGVSRPRHESFSRSLGSIEESIDVQDRSIHAAARSALLYAESSFDHALNAGLEAAEAASVVGAGNQAVKQGLVWAVEAALVLGKREQANELLTMVEQLPPGLRPPFLEAHTHRFRARMDSNEAGFKTAAGSFREYGFPFWLAVTQLEHGEWLVAQGRTEEAESHLTEAREIFERLEARPWLERLDAVAPRVAEVSA